MQQSPRRFRIALSFAGEHRPFVARVAEVLGGHLGRDRILYDKFLEPELARPDLDTYLQNLYHDASDLVAIFLSKNYEHKEWCRLEWRAIRDLIKKRRGDSIILLQFEGVEIPGLFSGDGYVPIGERTAAEIADVILVRLAGLPPTDSAAVTNPRDRASNTPQPRLRAPPAMPWPAEPYPLLLPYAKPELFGGRASEIDRLCNLVTGRQLILGVYATSGAGKSSLIDAGLVPRLRERGFAVARDRHPAELFHAASDVDPSGVLERLLDDLFEVAPHPNSGAPAQLLEGLAHARRTTNKPPILILDQFEDLLRPGTEQQRMTVEGALLATSARRGEWDDTVCRWILVYRQEFHGRVFSWLSTLSTNLAEVDRFHCWEPPSFGLRPTIDETEQEFLDAIERPLRLEDDRGAARYRCQFAAGDARRLARAFATARQTQPEAPLVPELQVVLERLCREAHLAPNGMRVFHVHDDVDALVQDALTEHLRAALKHVVPDDGQAREHQFLLLRALVSLVSEVGLRGPARTDSELACTLGHGGSQQLEMLAGARWRILLTRTLGGSIAYELAHDRLAEVVLEESKGDHWGEDGAEIARLVDLLQRRVSDFQDGQHGPAMRLRRSDYRALKRRHGLIASNTHRNWWVALRKARLQRLLGAGGFIAILILVATLGTLGVRRYADARRLDNGAGPERLKRLADLGHLWPWEVNEVTEDGELAELVRVFEGVDDDWDADTRSEVVYRAVRAAKPLLMRSLGEWTSVRFQPLGSALRLLDRFPLANATWGTKAAALRQELLSPLGPPPELPMEHWVDVPPTGKEGDISLLLGDNEGRKSERPAHRVRLTGFHMLRTEVTNAMFRSLVPEAPGDENHPMVGLSWDAAYVYAAWLGGRLPTEAEWEYAARAGDTKDVRGEAPRQIRPVASAPANAWGLYDIPGNASEMTLDWYAPYAASDDSDPWGPLLPPRARAFVVRDVPGLRSGVFHVASRLRSTAVRPEFVGFRVVKTASHPTSER